MCKLMDPDWLNSNKHAKVRIKTGPIWYKKDPSVQKNKENFYFFSLSSLKPNIVHYKPAVPVHL